MKKWGMFLLTLIVGLAWSPGIGSGQNLSDGLFAMSATSSDELGTTGLVAPTVGLIMEFPMTADISFVPTTTSPATTSATAIMPTTFMHAPAPPTSLTVSAEGAPPATRPEVDLLDQGREVLLE